MACSSNSQDPIALSNSRDTRLQPLGEPRLNLRPSFQLNIDFSTVHNSRVESLPEYEGDADSRRIVELNFTGSDNRVADRASEL
jgi:hypothetical protein